MAGKIDRTALTKDCLRIDQHFSGSIDVTIVVCPGQHCRLEDISISQGDEPEVWVRDIEFEIGG